MEASSLSTERTRYDLAETGRTSSAEENISNVRPNEAELCKRHEPWLRKLAAKYSGEKSGPLFDDMMQEGAIAVIQGARAWREDGGASFLTYATNNIKRRMMRRLGRNPVVPRSNRDRDAGNYDLPRTISLDAPMQSSEGEQDAYECGRDGLHTGATQEDDAIASERAAVVRKVLATLPQKDGDIVTAVMEGSDYRTVAREHGCSKSHVEDVMNKCLPVLKRRLQKELDHGR